MTKDYEHICTTLFPNCICLSAAVWPSDFLRFPNASLSISQSKSPWMWMWNCSSKSAFQLSVLQRTLIN